MTIKQENPFPVVESDRHAIWEMVVRRDIEAFLAADWAMVANDFMEENFMGDRCRWILKSRLLENHLPGLGQLS